MIHRPIISAYRTIYEDIVDLWPYHFAAKEFAMNENLQEDDLSLWSIGTVRALMLRLNNVYRREYGHMIHPAVLTHGKNNNPDSMSLEHFVEEFITTADLYWSNDLSTYGEKTMSLLTPFCDIALANDIRFFNLNYPPSWDSNIRTEIIKKFVANPAHMQLPYISRVWGVVNYIYYLVVTRSVL